MSRTSVWALAPAAPARANVRPRREVVGVGLRMAGWRRVASGIARRLRHGAAAPAGANRVSGALFSLLRSGASATQPPLSSLEPGCPNRFADTGRRPTSGSNQPTVQHGRMKLPSLVEECRRRRFARRRISARTRHRTTIRCRPAATRGVGRRASSRTRSPPASASRCAGGRTNHRAGRRPAVVP